MRKHWTKKEIEYLKDNYNLNYEELMIKLSRTYRAIVMKASNLGIKKKRNNYLLIKRNIEHNPMKNRENVRKVVIKNTANGTYDKSSIRMTSNNPTKNGMSENWKKNIGIASKRRWEEDTVYSKKMFVILSIMQEKAKSVESIKKRKIKRRSQILPLKDSSIEVKIQTFLTQLKIEFFTHQYIKIEHGYQCDILIPSMNLVIECDGDYWHGNPEKFCDEKLTEIIIKQRKIDELRTNELIKKGYNVLRLWEHEIKEMDINGFNKKLNINESSGCDNGEA